MNFLQKKYGDEPSEIINLGRVNHIKRDYAGLSITFRLFNETDETVWVYDNEEQVQRQYGRVLKALGLNKNG